MRLEGSRPAYIVEVERLGHRFYALVTGTRTAVLRLERSTGASPERRLSRATNN
jgi:hypothetical protein